MFCGGMIKNLVNFGGYATKINKKTSKSTHSFQSITFPIPLICKILTKIPSLKNPNLLIYPFSLWTHLTIHLILNSKLWLKTSSCEWPLINNQTFLAIHLCTSTHSFNGFSTNNLDSCYLSVPECVGLYFHRSIYKGTFSTVNFYLCVGQIERIFVFEKWYERVYFVDYKRKRLKNTKQHQSFPPPVEMFGIIKKWLWNSFLNQQNSKSVKKSKESSRNINNLLYHPMNVHLPQILFQ